MWKATFTSLWSRKLRLAMSMLAIVLGTAFVSGSFIFGDMLKGSFDQIISGSVPDVQVMKKLDESVEGGSPTQSKLTPEIIEKIKKVEGVKDAAGGVSGIDTMVIGTNGKALVSFGPPQLGFNWITLPSLGGKTGVHLVQGHEPQADDQVVLDPDTLKKSGYSIGDKIKVITPQGTIPVTVVGTGTVGEGSTAGASYVFFTTKKAQELYLEGQNAFTQVWTVTEPGADRTKVAADVQKVLPKGFEAKDGQKVVDEESNAIGQALGFVNTFLLVFAGISLLVASFLIINTFTILVAQRSKELALFRAMGASRSQIRNTVLVEALVTGLIGSVIGLFAGVGLALVIKSGMKLVGWDMGAAPIHISPTAIIASILAGVLVTLFAALWPARRATKVAPVEAMTAAKTEVEKGLGVRAIIGTVLALGGAAMVLLGLFTSIAKPVAWAGIGMALAMVGVALASPMLGRPVVWLVGKLYRAVYGEVGKLAELNSIRQPRRTAATASALMIGLTLVSMMAVFGASSTRSVTHQVKDTIRGDYMVGQQGFREFPAHVVSDVEKVPQVQSVETMRSSVFLTIPKGADKPPQDCFTSMTGKCWAMVAGMDASSLDKIFPQKIVQGRMFSADNEMIVDEKTAEKQNLKVGDTETYWSQEAQRKFTFTVVGIFTTGNAQAIGDKWVSTTTLTSAGLGQKVTFMSIYLKPGTDHAQARRDLDAAVADMPLVSVMDVGEYTQQVLGNVNRTMSLLYGLLALSVIIAILGIINTLGLSIIERTREIGLLRAIALTRGQVRRMITLESVVIALLGAVVGVGLGTAFGVVLQRLLVDQGIDRLSIPWAQLAAFLVAAGVIGVLAALWPAHRAARTNMLAAIATE